MNISKNDCAVVITSKRYPDLPKRLIDAFSDPVDSYWNGSHTWFSDFEEIELEWRLHPISGFKMPEASRPEDLLDLALEGEIETEHYWEGLEVFVIGEKTCSPETLAKHVEEVLNIEVEAKGMVNHDEIGNAFERNNGNISIVQLLLNQISEQS